MPFAGSMVALVKIIVPLSVSLANTFTVTDEVPGITGIKSGIAIGVGSQSITTKIRVPDTAGQLAVAAMV